MHDLAFYFFLLFEWNAEHLHLAIELIPVFLLLLFLDNELGVPLLDETFGGFHLFFGGIGDNYFFAFIHANI